MTTLVLPWPSRDLSPNARVHWSRRSHAAALARDEARILAIAAGWARMSLPEGRLHLWVDFYPPTRQRHDDDNMLSRFKPHRDGIADALGIDDARFVSHPYVRDEVRKGGQVVVRITAGPQTQGEVQG